MFSDDHLINTTIRNRRESVFLILAGLFLGSLTMLNILGLTRLLEFEILGIPFPLTLGVLPYPLTFLCTDFISELYGRRRANTLVMVGLLLNIWVLLLLWLGGILPPEIVTHDETGKLIMQTPLDGLERTSRDYIFSSIQTFTFATTFGSMVAYLIAQFLDVHIFHYLKDLTQGKHLWLRNNGSTLISQLVDSIAVICIAQFYGHAFDDKIAENNGQTFATLSTIIIAGYAFKILAALLDTIPFYFGVQFLSKYLEIDTIKKYKKK
jgi:uncharacterized PurR-regulated membrane protein YhhQ (DUF165 family)